jgi:PAS domain S-box-containing protein
MNKKKKGISSSSSGKAKAESQILADLTHFSLNSTNQVVFVVDTDMCLLLVNEAFRRGCRAAGIPDDNILGKNIFEVYPFISKRILDEFREVIQTRKQLTKKEDRIRIENSEVIYESRKIPLIHNDQVTHIVTVVTNITDRKLAEEALQDSEAKYRQLVENVGARICVSNYDGTIRFMNNVGASALGMTQKNIIGKTHWDLFPKDEADRQVQNVRRVIDEGIELAEKVPVMVGDEERWFDTLIQPFRDAQGKIIAAIIIAIDITDRLRAREAMRASEAKYRLLVENVKAFICLADRDGKFLFINDIAAQAYGRTAEEIIGQTHWDLLPKENADRLVRNIRRVIDKGIEFSEQTQVIIGNEMRWFDAVVQPYKDANGKADVAMIIAVDITERREADEALRHSEERFRLQFASLPIPAYTWEYRDDEFFLVDYNKAAVTITKGNIKDYVGIKASEMYRNMPDVMNELKECLKNKTAFTREMPYRFMSTGEDKYLIVHYVYAPPNYVIVHTEDITDRKQAEDNLRKAHDDLEERVKDRTGELAEAVDALQVEREALRQKNIALNVVLDQIEDGKKEMASNIQLNINNIVLPILNSLEGKVHPAGKHHIDLLRSNLEDIAAPLVRTLETQFSQLTPRELEICNMVKNGMTCKEIAATLDTSVQTVLKQRAIIRKKLGIANSKTNLTSYLKSLE